MKLALNRPIHEFTDNGLKTWISQITNIHHLRISSPIKDVLLLSHGKRVILF